VRIFHCDRCGHTVEFSTQRCPNCNAELGFESEHHAMRVLESTGEPAAYRIASLDGVWWRCLNAAWGCNWLVPADSGETWCRSCRLTRGRPDEGRPAAIAAWMTAEAAKRRLVYQLDSIGLPIEPQSKSVPDGLTFDLVAIPEGATTGHRNGVVTLDLSEADDLQRHRVREQLDETYRTVIGHLRHEVGHYYWDRLVGQSDKLGEFRRLFGDERADYAAAIDANYAEPTVWDPMTHISAYATSHPLEDWAETFAHYLHILDIAETAGSHSLTAPAADSGTESGEHGRSASDFAQLLDASRPVIAAVNDVAAALGVDAVYPFDPRGVVVDKLAFVHRLVLAHTERDRFYAAN
jgi:hypothetical protein